MTIKIPRPSRVALGLVTAVLAIQACGYSTADSAGYPSGAAFTVALGAATLSIPPSGTAAVSIKAARTGGLTSAISYSVTGAPAGLAATVTNTNVPDSVIATAKKREQQQRKGGTAQADPQQAAVALPLFCLCSSRPMVSRRRRRTPRSTTGRRRD